MKTASIITTLLCLFSGINTFAGPTLTVGGLAQNAVDETTFFDATWYIADIANQQTLSIQMISQDGNWFGEAGHYLSNLSINNELLMW